MTKKSWLGFSTIELLLIFVIVGLLVAFVATKFSDVRQNSRDEQRKADLISLQAAIESYQAENGQYPAVAQINDANFRKDHLKTVTQGFIQDPKWSLKNKHCVKSGQSILLDTDKPAQGCYGYQTSPAGCDGKATECTSYVLTADLESGGIYQKKSLH